MQLSKRQKIIIIIAAVVLVGTLILGIRFSVKPSHKANLQIWGIEQNMGIWTELISNYKKEHSNVEITYTYKNPSSYKKDLLNAFAANKGPDLFMVLNSEVPQYIDNISSWVSDKEFGIKQIQETYPQVVINDFTQGDKIYGLPLYIDTLALYFNRSVFDYNNVALPPNTWEDTLRLSNQFRKIDRYDRISRAGIALGLGQNISWYNDILSAMMIQKGSHMVSDDLKDAAFNNAVEGANGTIYPGSEALSFYTQFSQTSKSAYTWNSLFSDSLEAFSSGKAAMVIGYNADRELIKEKAPDLNFGVAKLPYFANGINHSSFARYYGLSISSQSKETETSWDFLRFIATQEQAKLYFEQTKNPPARRDLIDYYKNDPEIGIFASQALSAKSWCQKDPATVKDIFLVMIQDVIYNGKDVYQATQDAADRVKELLRNE